MTNNDTGVQGIDLTSKDWEVFKVEALEIFTLWLKGNITNTDYEEERLRIIARYGWTPSQVETAYAAAIPSNSYSHSYIRTFPTPICTL